ncbi:unnamed protein product [Bursaphelenchus okinawaensis]|uniref:Uncharacterized protein n=1 Tax=Bursaphelenchus okinawaensis TaxID=465554 RepID=A0A811LH99_9BILA|nr:unnamed protein product [Bursaphelenchus okinawaensis]CAG9125283.1 unnamed protein product [Bursaphelenchus okinawaensis]
MLAVHCGIGRHLPGIDKLCSQAVKERDTVKAVMCLESDPRTNCGIGSSLTEDGQVECEGAYMQSENMLFGAVGALSNSKHPSLLSKKLVESTNNDNLIWPMVLVGKGAGEFAVKMDVPTCSQSELISDSGEVARKKAKLQLEQFDTVGALRISETGECEASISSGGILLKKRGRLGHSTVFGAGIWAEQRKDIDMSVCMTLSGCGECIMKTHMAEKIANDLFNNPEAISIQTIESSVQRNFVESPLLAAYSEPVKKLGGLVGVRKDGLFELVAFHNSHALPLAYSSGPTTKRRTLQGSDKHFVYEAFTINT